MSAKQILIDAKTLLETQGWTQKAYARDKDGNTTPAIPGLGEPVCFCSVGALLHAGGNADLALDIASDCLRDVLPGRDFSIIDFNDTPGRTKQEVLDVFQKAIDTCPPN